MEDTLRIRPVEGRTLPRENAPKSRITEPCPVPNTPYYRRALTRGDIAIDDGKVIVAAPVDEVAIDASGNATAEAADGSSVDAVEVGPGELASTETGIAPIAEAAPTTKRSRRLLSDNG